MAQLLHEINWSEPVVPVHHDPEWEARVRAKMGQVHDSYKLVAPVPWLREAILKWPQVHIEHLSNQQKNIAALVVAQENACRFCYGIARSYLRVYGLSESVISKLERQMHIAELDNKDRTFIHFCRDLARSNPRPSFNRRAELIELGFSEIAVKETAFAVSNWCFVNRVATFLSSPPVSTIERLSGSWIVRVIRPLMRRMIDKMEWNEPPLNGIEDTAFPHLVSRLRDLPMASRLINEGLNGVFSSEILSSKLKVLMFAVVARLLECEFCQGETSKMAEELGIDKQTFEEAISKLTAPDLSPEEVRILAWTRETVHYQTEQIQRQTRELARHVSNEQLLEAVGVAALANMTVRLAVLLD